MFDYTNFELHSNLSNNTHIHPTALVAKGAELDTNVIIGPNAIVGANVKLASGVRVGAGAIVAGHTSIGEQTHIYPMATVGSDPQDLKFANEPTQLIIGAHNKIREYANISLGTVGGGGKTQIGDHNLIMVYTHVAHDCYIGNHCIFANSVNLAGHIVIGDHTVFGGMSGGHQFCRFGDRSMVAAGAIVVQDVPPFCLVQGDRARVNGLNVVGLRRSGIDRAELAGIKKMFKTVYNENLGIDEAIEKIGQSVEDSGSKKLFLDFLKTSERGVCR